MDSSAPSNHFAKITENFPHCHSSLLFQLRSRHALLNKHLHHIVKADTAKCLQCNEGNESVHHFLFNCRAFSRQFGTLRNSLGTKAHHIKHILNDAECLKPLFEFITSTGRFNTLFGDIAPPKDKNK
jgi:hypothetical protein